MLDVLAGNHAVRIKRKSYIDWTGTVSVPADGKATIDEALRPNFAALSIAVEPPDAQIFLNGRMVATWLLYEPTPIAGGTSLRSGRPSRQRGGTSLSRRVRMCRSQSASSRATAR